MVRFAADGTRSSAPLTLTVDAALALQQGRVLPDVAARLRADLEGSGVVTVAGLGRLPPDAWTDAFVTLARVLGDLVAQDASGSEVRSLRDRTEELGATNVRYSDGSGGGGYHTDGVGLEGPVPDYFGLLCSRQALVGGDLVLLDVAEVWDRLVEQASWAVAVLEQPVAFERRGTSAASELPVERAIMARRRDTPLIVYLREYIESAHTGARRLTADQVAAMDALDAVLATPDLQMRLRLAPGDIVLVSNTRFLHGRVAFSDSDRSEGRLLWRVWLRLRSRGGEEGRDFAQG